jgi:hypothetical protein
MSNEIEIAIPALVATIKAHLAKGAQSHEKSEQHYVTAGLRLKELKARKPSETPWPEYLRETFNLGRARADELIRIADGRTSVEQVRAGGATRAARNIAKLKSGVTNAGAASASAEDSHATEPHQIADAGSPADAVKTAADRAATKTPTPVPDVTAAADRAEVTSAKPMLSEIQRVDGQIKPLCHFDLEDPGDVEEPGDSMEMIRHRIFTNHANEALRHAREHGFDEAADSEVTDVVVGLAKTVAKAWTDQVAALERRQLAEVEAARQPGADQSKQAAQRKAKRGGRRVAKVEAGQPEAAAPADSKAADS